ncbi:MAG: hypothetical protein Q4A01_08130 [Coriobacteriales bacterium]|nr:hypothetical protein [Coriobacteriales bacterium]
MAGKVATINVRLDSTLKDAGDAALAEEGVSVSQIVRALWTKLAERGKAMEDLKRLLLDESDEAQEQETPNPVARGWELADEFCLRVGYDPSKAHKQEQAWDELYAHAMDEQYAQRGLFL